MIKDYKNQVIVITGAATGIGKALAKGCVERGATQLVLNDINPEILAPTAAEIRDMGAEVTEVIADVSLAVDCRKIFDVTMKTYGRVDVLVNNAGISAPARITDILEQDIKWLTEVNFYSLCFMMKIFIPQMMKQKSHCTILNVCSIAGLLTAVDFPVYYATKHAAVGISESVYKWLGQIGADIDMKIFCPAMVQTDLHLCDRNRPQRFALNDDPFYQSEKYDELNDKNEYMVKTGMPLDQAIDEVFQALGTEDFYILSHRQLDPVIKEWGSFTTGRKRPVDFSDLPDLMNQGRE